MPSADFLRGAAVATAALVAGVSALAPLLRQATPTQATLTLPGSPVSPAFAADDKLVTFANAPVAVAPPPSGEVSVREVAAVMTGERTTPAAAVVAPPAASSP